LTKKQSEDVEKISDIYQASKHVSYTKRNILAQKLPEITDIPFNLRICIYGPGTLVGEEDLI